MARFLVVGILLLSLIACKEEKIESPAVASVNDQILTEQDLRDNFTADQWERLSKEERDNFINKWIDLVSMAQQAEVEGITDSPVVQQRIKNAELKIKANLYIASQISNIKVDEEEMFNYYQVHKSEYQKNALEYKVQQIVIDDISLKDSIKTNIENNKFSYAAKKFSKGKAASNGGYIGFVGQNDINSVIWKDLSGLSKYELSTKAIGNKIYYSRWYKTRKIKVVKTFDETKAEIEKILKKNKQKDIYNNSLKKAKKDKEIRYL